MDYLTLYIGFPCSTVLFLFQFFSIFSFLNHFPLQLCCSEISCNVKLNVYLAMKIPDCVSFVSG